MNATAHLTLPRLAGTRAAAAEFCAATTNRLFATTVVIDASHCVSMAQGYADELVKQLLVIRYAPRVEVRGASGPMVEYLTDAAERREVRGLRLLVST